MVGVQRLLEGLQLTDNGDKFDANELNDIGWNSTCPGVWYKNEVKMVPKNATAIHLMYAACRGTKFWRYQNISTRLTRAVGKGISFEISPLPTQVAHFTMALPALLPYSSWRCGPATR
ncbi:hypothetical protein PC116_g6720 [Phytophthora cactorum]|uniref:Uncharacterized protein n=1 Tax=Phytophthora cactorum TaxID=29920 RepID=A0A8T1LEX2_9STRA|nr:hypothetical protein PC111_g13935 [Phytophthora cactorum]KAG2821908.1 hypothetical protein PC112_g11177 [Phytophthora cactorum]KAG2862694.1 hypothetical protein PC113_g6054 [Phytophthora cactorum]KAG2915044.1 hypothetical protein PC114_g7976 [Phytophthora cactorum]KAG2929573.1 hypothetical protein PC115_g6809 [Phytophthora cactorum]